MSEQQGSPDRQAAVQTVDKGAPSLLDQAIGATRHTEPDRAEELIRALTEQALDGVVTFDREVQRSLGNAIKAIDQRLSEQLVQIMHAEAFKKLEGSWRGLHYLVMNSETGQDLKIRLLQASKRELLNDFERAVEFDQSLLWQKVYEDEFGMPGGSPMGAMIGDYEFTNHPEDIEFLRHMSGVAAGAFCPFLSAVGPQMFELESWRDMRNVRDLSTVFDTVRYAAWRSFRDSEDSRFVSLTMPRTLARLPYGSLTRAVEAFDYEEAPIENGVARPMDPDDYCWMNTAYVLGARLTDAFARTGFCTAIRGAENGGKVENLPMHVFESIDGDVDSQCPTEVGIPDRREAEFSKLGFLPLCHYKERDHAVFFGGQTTQKAKKYDQHAATENAAICARLPYIMATSRFAHYLKVMARDWIGSNLERDDVERRLHNWIHNYVESSDNASIEARTLKPLKAAQIEVQPIPGSPGAYNAVAHLRPWLQLEELTTSMRLVASIPQRSA